MKKTLILFMLSCCVSLSSYAQAPEYPEPEFIGQVLAVLPDDKTTPLVQESLTPRHRETTTSVLFGIGKTKREVTLNGPRSVMRLKPNNGIALIVRVPDNRIDPMSAISVFHFESTKKRRQAEYASVGALGDMQTNTLDRQPFIARRFGESSYLLILKEAQPGEYGITVAGTDELTVSTFGIDE